MQVIETASKIVRYEEGFRDRPYYCSEGYPTVGYGFKIGDEGDPLPKFRLPQGAAAAWLDYLITQGMAYVEGAYPKDLSPVRKAVLISMWYQLGPMTDFVNTNRFIREGRYLEASSEMLDSKWYRQTPERALRHSDMMKSNHLLHCYG